jgi:PAS domain S-box-containing protein
MIIYVNPAAQTLVGASRPEEMVGKAVLDFVDCGSRDAVRENIKKDLGGEFSPQMELQMIRLDGTSVTVEGRGVQTLIEGKPAVLVAIWNITGRKQSEKNLLESERTYRVLAIIGEAIGADIAYIYEDTRSSPSGPHLPVRRFHWVAKTGEMDSTPSTHHACGDKFSREWAERLASGAWVTDIRSRFFCSVEMISSRRKTE